MTATCPAWQPCQCCSSQPETLSDPIKIKCISILTKSSTKSPTSLKTISYVNNNKISIDTPSWLYIYSASPTTSTPSSSRLNTPPRPTLRPNLTWSEEHQDPSVVDLLWSGCAGTRPTVWTLTPRAERPSCAPLLPLAPGCWHHMAHSHIYHSSTSLPSAALYLRTAALAPRPLCRSLTERGLRKEKREWHRPQCHFTHLLSREGNRSCGLKAGASEESSEVDFVWKLPGGH